MTATSPRTPIPSTMQAVVHHRYGSPSQLRLTTLPTPKPGPEQVLVKIVAASLNPADVFTLAGSPWLVRTSEGLLRPKTHVRGTDGAGVVVAVGEEVEGWRVGDEAFGALRGTLAEYAVTNYRNLAHLPAGVGFEHAAASVMTGLTAMQALRKRSIGPGSRVLVTGASGGVGSYAVQFAKAAGAHVTAVCSTVAVDRVAALGADVVVDYTKESVTELPGGFEIILDNVGAWRMRDLERLTTPSGLLLTNSGRPGPDGGAITRVTKAAIRGRLFGKRVSPFMASTNPADLVTIGTMLADGSLRPLIDTMFPLEAAADAMERVASAHAKGKVVVSVGNSGERGTAGGPRILMI